MGFSILSYIHMGGVSIFAYKAPCVEIQVFVGLNHRMRIKSFTAWMMLKLTFIIWIRVGKLTFGLFEHRFGKDALILMWSFKHTWVHRPLTSNRCHIILKLALIMVVGVAGSVDTALKVKSRLLIWNSHRLLLCVFNAWWLSQILFKTQILWFLR